MPLCRNATVMGLVCIMPSFPCLKPANRSAALCTPCYSKLYSYVPAICFITPPQLDQRRACPRYCICLITGLLCYWTAAYASAPIMTNLFPPSSKEICAICLYFIFAHTTVRAGHCTWHWIKLSRVGIHPLHMRHRRWRVFGGAWTQHILFQLPSTQDDALDKISLMTRLYPDLTE
jgi:hypothetical protein